MKYYFAVFLILPLLFYGCKTEEVAPSPSVDEYITLLRADQYDSMKLPAFGYSDIETLLGYRDDTTTIHNFPRNPASSYSNPKCQIGVIALWTIESIRVSKTNQFPERFPSINPLVSPKKNPGKFLYNYHDEAYREVSDAYYPIGGKGSALTEPTIWYP